ncbi:hypothetical protein AB0L05_42070 [Nonomuraea pusilla]|uniref:hypothetical protein n=1 Tax=Nonomuraea pusilla TaxID=46177 RepID=UPI00332BFB7A
MSRTLIATTATNGFTAYGGQVPENTKIMVLRHEVAVLRREALAGRTRSSPHWRPAAPLGRGATSPVINTEVMLSPDVVVHTTHVAVPTRFL